MLEWWVCHGERVRVDIGRLGIEIRDSQAPNIFSICLFLLRGLGGLSGCGIVL